MRTRAPRRDAQARREALITAAAECFAEQGYRVPLEEVADRAKVSRATLYRNFKDRDALVLAIFAREVERFKEVLDPEIPIGEAILRMVRSGAKASALSSRIGSELKLDEENVEAFKALGRRLCELLEPTAAAARARGELRPDVSAEHLVQAVRMVGGLVKMQLGEAEAEAEIASGLEIVLRGLLPR